MAEDAECTDCAGSGEICSSCCAPTDWCGCEHGEMLPMVFTCRTCHDPEA